MGQPLDGRRALVTGGSAGLGVDFARQLAERGADITVVARREERLREVADELEDAYGVAADWVSMDLTDGQAAETLYETVDGRGHRIDILVNNAGFGVYGDFLETDLEAQETMLELDVLAPVRLTHVFARGMVERGWGRLVQVASIGAFQPTPKYSAYSAAKSFVKSWGEAIDYELREHGVSCTVVCPGVTETEFFDAAGQDDRTWYQRFTMMDSSTVASIGVRAMMKQKLSVVPGLLNALNAWLTRFTPPRIVRWVAHMAMKDA